MRNNRRFFFFLFCYLCIFRDFVRVSGGGRVWGEGEGGVLGLCRGCRICVAVGVGRVVLLRDSCVVCVFWYICVCFIFGFYVGIF